jgi:hypothetical protein
MEILTPSKPPFSLRSVVHSHGWMQLASFRYDEQVEALAYTARLGSGRVVDRHS